MPANPLRILLVKEDELFHLGLQMRLQQESSLEVVEAENGKMAVEMAKQMPIDVVVLGIRLLEASEIEVCCQFKQQQPDLPVLVLTSSTQPSLIPRLIEAGVQGYCLKGTAPATLILAIRSVAVGASWWDAIATSAIRSAIKNQALSEIKTENPNTHSWRQTNLLTRREQEILILLSSGKRSQEIAQLLHISTSTVRVHIHSVLNKLSVDDRKQAVALALRQGLIAQDLLSNQEI